MLRCASRRSLGRGGGADIADGCVPSDTGTNVDVVEGVAEGVPRRPLDSIWSSRLSVSSLVVVTST